jgi:hypothetical protein
LWGITMNARQCCGRRGFHARRLKRE